LHGGVEVLLGIITNLGKKETKVVNDQEKQSCYY
jgi:hypothetical protein